MKDLNQLLWFFVLLFFISNPIFYVQAMEVNDIINLMNEKFKILNDRIDILEKQNLILQEKVMKLEAKDFVPTENDKKSPRTPDSLQPLTKQMFHKIVQYLHPEGRANMGSACTFFHFLVKEFVSNLLSQNYSKPFCDMIFNSGGHSGPDMEYAIRKKRSGLHPYDEIFYDFDEHGTTYIPEGCIAVRKKIPFLKFGSFNKFGDAPFRLMFERENMLLKFSQIKHINNDAHKKFKEVLDTHIMLQLSHDSTEYRLHIRKSSGHLGYAGGLIGNFKDLAIIIDPTNNTILFYDLQQEEILSLTLEGENTPTFLILANPDSMALSISMGHVFYALEFPRKNLYPKEWNINDN